FSAQLPSAEAKETSQAFAEKRQPAFSRPSARLERQRPHPVSAAVSPPAAVPCAPPPLHRQYRSGGQTMLRTAKRFLPVLGQLCNAHPSAYTGSTDEEARPCCVP